MKLDPKRRARDHLEHLHRIRHGVPKVNVPKKEVLARKKNEDYRMAREIGCSVEDIQ